MMSSRPGARLTRIGLSGENSAASSARTREISCGTGSRLSRLCGLRGGGGGLTTLSLPGLGFDDDPIEKSPAPTVERRGQNITSAGADLRIFQLKKIRPARAIPARDLLLARV